MQPPGGQLPPQRKAEGLRRAVTASDEAITRYSRQIDAMAAGISRLIKRLESGRKARSKRVIPAGVCWRLREHMGVF
jgi:hypothetical protein